MRALMARSAIRRTPKRRLPRAPLPRQTGGAHADKTRRPFRKQKHRKPPAPDD
jgi:hypothetical protein